MPWVRTEDRARCHPKFFRAGFAAFGWWSAGLGYCNEHLTNGFIATRNLELVFPGALPAEREAAIESLVREGLLHTVSKGQSPACPGPFCRRFTAREDGYLMHDYLAYQPSRKHVEVVRSGRVQAARKGHDKSAKVREQNAIAQREQNGLLPIQPNPTQSNPIQKEELPALSGKPDRTPKNGFREEAEQILAFLNEKAGRSYRAVPENLRLISGRLKSGATVENCRGVIVRKVREWNKDPAPGQQDMRKFLRPATLFNATNFEQYLGEREAVDAR